MAGAPHQLADAPRLAIVGPLKSWGGIEGKLVTLMGEFLRLGVVPEFVRIRGGEIPYPARLPSAVRIRELETRSKRDGVPALARYLRESRPAAVLTAKDHAAQTALLARMWSGVRVPVFVKVTNTLSIVARRRLQRAMIRRLYPKAERMIGNSSGVCADLRSEFGVPAERIALIHNPTVTEDFPARAAADVDHPWLQSERDIPVILGVGRFTEQKDFATLLEAFARLRQQRPCRLLLLGDGPERLELTARARSLAVAEDVDMPGFVLDALPYMARASVFALSSRYEGLSNVLIESMAVGTPAISTDCPSGSAEILGGGAYGPLVAVGDDEGLASGLAHLLDRPTSAAQLTEAVERFRAAPVAATYLRVMGLAGTP